MLRAVFVAILSSIVRRYLISPGARHCGGWGGFSAVILCG